MNIWAAGDSGIVIHTSNAGQSWIIQPTPVNYFVENLFFLNQRLGWGISHNFNYNNTVILKTTNGGTNWLATYYLDTSQIFNAIYFLDSLNGYLSGYSGLILRSTNAGANWSQCSVDSSFYAQFPVRNIAFQNSQIGYGCGGVMDFAGVVWNTTDAGSTWFVQNVAPEPINFIQTLSLTSAVGTGGDFEFGASIVRTSNAGVNWTYRPLSFFGVGQRIIFRTKYESWIPLGFSQRWAVSFDTLTTWHEIPAPDTASIYDAIFADSLHGWAFGSSGAIYKFNVAAIGIRNNENNLPAQTELMQNYPNPFNPATTIAYKLSRPGRIKITLYDILGREVRVLFDGFQKAGDYHFRFDAEGLASGVYFYKLETGISSLTKKMVLVR
jgi:photosystem II stability/assembly factor-like uncharacterized protein